MEDVAKTKITYTHLALIFVLIFAIASATISAIQIEDLRQKVGKIENNSLLFETNLKDLIQNQKNLITAIDKTNNLDSLRVWSLWYLQLNESNKVRYRAIIPDLLFCFNQSDVIGSSPLTNNEILVQYRDSRAMFINMSESDLRIYSCVEGGKDISCIDFCKEFRL